MTNNPDEIRADIEATRRELGSNVDALADKVTPSKIVGRQTEKVKGALGSARDRIMGSASDLRDSSSAGLSDAAGGVSDAAGAARSKIQGNPLAVGLIVFGAAWLASSLAPATEREKQVAGRLKEAAEPLMEDLTDAAKAAGQNLRGPAMDAANAIKDAASDGVDHVRDEATSAVSDVKDQAGEARDAIQQSH